jgi:drug/metabolite transporter (DMT)-like permease
VLDYGSLFWAEQRVPSGVAAVILATIPAFMTLSEIFVLRTRPFTFRLGLALLVGLLGVAALMNNSASLGGAPVDRAGAIAHSRAGPEIPPVESVRSVTTTLQISEDYWQHLASRVGRFEQQWSGLK